MDNTNERGDGDKAEITPVEPLEPLSRRTNATRQRLRRRTGSGDRDLDQKIADLVATVDVADADLLQQGVETLFRMSTVANRAEMKLVSRSLRELGRAFRIFAPYRAKRKVSLFGSARTPADHGDYRIAREFGETIVARGWMVITGAGPGIMEAGHEGAGAANSFGVGIKLPMEQGANGFIAGDPKLIDFKYFFNRKIMFVKESDAFVLFPGGYGTLDEGFELLTLMQTGKAAIRPVVLLEPEDGTYWEEWLTFVREHLVERGLCSMEDLSLVESAHSAEAAAAIIERFYSNYNSARYVGERLVIRVRRAPSKEQLAQINEQFADLVLRGHITAIGITPEESRDGDNPDLERIAFFPRSNFGRLRQLIDALNLLS